MCSLAAAARPVTSSAVAEDEAPPRRSWRGRIMRATRSATRASRGLPGQACDAA
jgi:hypothetical protein